MVMSFTPEEELNENSLKCSETYRRGKVLVPVNLAFKYFKTVREK
jgi:hypothetical protein